MATIAKAYVQIIPSAEGIQGQLNNMLSDEASEAGSNAGSAIAGGISKALGGVAKVAAGAFAAAGTAVGAMTKQAVDGYKDFEQLEGGIETLFGKAAPTVMKNAEKAFQSAGQSMNDYMETSIQSAAAMITSLNGDQAKAAELMDMSIVDMADNVNKMGTSMEGVQNAYRGFSRGNFTMLDNLAMGFAGTKEGMQQLLDKAKELSGIEYNIDSYADIVQAIHVVQEEMGIAGTTAKEGAETIEGSLSQLKAAWQNLVSGLANPDADLGKLIDNVVKSGETALDNLMPAIEHALIGIAEFIEKAAPIIADKLPGIIEKILPSLLNAASIIVDSLIKALPSLMDAVAKTISQNPEIITTLGPIIMAKLASGLIGNMDMLKPVGDMISKKLGSSISTASLSGAATSVGSFMTADMGATLAAGGAAAGATVGTAIAGGAVAAVGGAEAGKKIGALLFPDDAELYEEYSGITGTFDMLGEFFVTLFERIGEHLSNAWAVISEFFGNVKGEIVTWWSGVSETFLRFFDEVAGRWNEFWTTVYEFYQPVIEAIQYTASAVFDAIKQKFTDDIEAIKAIISAVGALIEEYVFPLLLAGQEKIEGIIEDIKQKFSEDIDAIKEIMNGIMSFIEGTIFPIVYAVQEKIEGVIEGIKQKFTDDINSIKELFESLGGFFSELGEKARKWGSDLMQSFADGFEEGKDKIASGIRGIGDKIRANMGHSHPTEGPLADDYKWMPDMMDLFVQGIQQGSGSVKNAMNTLAGDVRGSMPQIAASLQSGNSYSAEVAAAGYGDLTIPVYIGNQKFANAVVGANQINNYRSGGR